MADAEEMNVTLSDRQLHLMREAVAAGDYATTGDILREAMRDWQEKREAMRRGIARLQALWDAGKASGAPQPLDFDELRTEARGMSDSARQRG